MINHHVKFILVQYLDYILTVIMIEQHIFFKVHHLREVLILVFLHVP